MRVCRLRALAGELRDVIKFNFNQKVRLPPSPPLPRLLLLARTLPYLPTHLPTHLLSAWSQVLGSMELFKELSESEKATLVDALVEIPFENGDAIIKQGEAGDAFYIIKSGGVKVTSVNEGAARQGSPQCPLHAPHH